MATTRAPTTRWENIDAYVLHTYPYKETSLIVEVFSSTLGRIAVVAKGAKRPNSALRGLMQPFLPLQIAFSGKSEIKTLTRAEWTPGQTMLNGTAIMVGYYLNELVIKLVARDDPHPVLYAAYAQAVAEISLESRASGALRKFELTLLAELGYGLNVGHCADSGAAIVADGCYAWEAERGIVSQKRAAGYAISGAAVLALSGAANASAESSAQAKRFMRHVLDFYLERRGLASRQLLRDVQSLMEIAA